MERRYYDIHTHLPRPEVCSPRAVGIHPWDAVADAPLPDLSTAEIIGETGLDALCRAPLDVQEQLFRRHLAEAERLHKPVVLHVVRSFERVMNILRDYRIEGVVFHGFIGSVQQAARCYERGYYLSFGARSLRASRTRDAIALCPSERLFVESDDLREPTIETLCNAVAELRGCNVESLLQSIEQNYNRLIYRR